MRRRCEWCARFVSANAPTTRWRSKNASGEWHDHEMALCAHCRRGARLESSFWVALPDRVDAE